MQITDHSKEQVLLGVQRLRTMASSTASNMGSCVATELSMSLSSSARPIKPSPCTPPPVQLDLLPLYPSTPNPNPNSYLQHHHHHNPKLFFPKSQVGSNNMCVTPVSLMQSNSSFAHTPPSHTSHHHPLLQAGLSVNPSFLMQVSKGADVGAHNNPLPLHASRGVDIDVNQVPSSSDSDDDDEGDDEGAYPSLQLSESINNNGLLRGSFSAMEGSPTSLKREREKVGSENNHTNNSNNNMYEVNSRASDEEEGASTRKKLRLSKEQSALLEESFKEHSTLNPKQKNALAKQLNLQPRQVEVWFQNRRARTKLKQTEVDCELLKRCCESLTEENRRLQKEVQELRALKVGAPCVIAHDFYMPLPAATLTMCPSCERLATRDPASRSSAKQHLPPALTFNPHHPQPSAAC